jgi:hypothetical protein
MPRRASRVEKLFQKRTPTMDKWVIFEHDAIPSTLAEDAAKEALAAPKKPTTDELWCEKELGKACGKIIGVCTQFLDGVGLPTTVSRRW